MARRSQKIDARPLYEQVREALLQRVQAGHWPPGGPLPSEPALAAELGVSQGTVRKALDALAKAHIVVRRQGRGTFVVEQTPAHVLFRFFNIFSDDGVQVLPDSTKPRVTKARANAREIKHLGLAVGADVIRVNRVRTHAGMPFMVETISLPCEVFPDLAKRTELPNTLYDFFQRQYGQLVVRADERVTAVVARARAARLLKIEMGSPLLRIDRVAYGIDERALEWRVSLCHLTEAHYLARLG
jgi:GntR family transcriptional regulator